MKINKSKLFTSILIGFVLLFSVWYTFRGIPVKEIVLPGGFAVKFGEKPQDNDIYKPENAPIKRTSIKAQIKEKRKEVKDDIAKPGISIKQNTNGSQSPVINAGNNAIVTYK